MIGVRHRKEEPLDVDMNRVITPMLDLAFQVLLFFIFTYHPSQVEEGQMDLTLPDAAKEQALNPKDANPKDSMPGDLELPAEITVLVQTQHDEKALGKISRISVQDKVGKTDVENPAALRKYLAKARSGLSNQNDIKIQADSNLKYSYVMEVMDMCTRAGFKNVSFGPPPDSSAGR
jgi:biopolymer transport protein ExbD